MINYLMLSEQIIAVILKVIKALRAFKKKNPIGRVDKWSRGKTGLPQARGMKNRYESPRRCSPAFGRLPTRRGDS